MRNIGIGLFGVFCAFSIIAFSVYKIEPEEPRISQPTPAVLGKPKSVFEIQTVKLEYQNLPLTAKVSFPIKTADIQLFSNLEKTETSVEIMTQHSCDLLVNGTFYTTDNTHGGLFQTEYIQIQPFVRNSTYNSIFSINDFETPRITNVIPGDQLRIALQTGPFLWENGDALDLSINNDKPARRMILGVTGLNEVVFIALYSTQSAFAGPYLEDVPELLSEINSRLELDLADATNLDGGSASVFATDNFSLPEASSIGSYFCITNHNN